MVLSRRQFLEAGAAALAASCVPASAFGGSNPGGGGGDGGKRKPNLVYIFADQMRADAMSCAGCKQITTPHFDALATSGVMATNALSTTPVCTPYRGMLMTGRYPHETGITHNDEGLRDDETVISEALKQGGYTTGYIGKWHLADNRRDPVNATNRRGWDFWAVRNCSHKHFKPEYWLNDAKTPVTVKGWEPDVQTDLAVEFIKQRKDVPFSLFLSFGPPHGPYGAPRKYRERCKHPYYAAILSLDDCLGRIDKALHEADIADNTILIFTSDHGDLLREHRDADNKQKVKRRPYRGSADVPFLIRWPGGMPAGKRYTEPFATVDLMPTLLGLCDVAIPAKVSGKDQSAALHTGSGGRQEVLMALYRGAFGVPPWRALRTERWLYAYYATREWMLYDIQKDPNEKNNLIDNPAFAKVRADLRKRTEALRKEIGDDVFDVKSIPRERKGKKR